MFEFEQVRYKTIVDIPGLSIEEGMTIMLGPSGSGKTTVLKLLNKMLSPTAGQILFDGMDLRDLKSVEHRRKVMMLSQTPVIFEGTVRDNLAMGLRFQGKADPSDGQMQDVLSDVRMRMALDQPAQLLSGGERQRLALARLFLCDPAVYLLDEPSAALDDRTEEAVIQMVAEHIKAAFKSAVIVTHSRAVAERHGDWVIEFSGGRVVRKEARV